MNKMVYTNCPICGSKKNYKVVYEAIFSSSDLNKDIFSARRSPDRRHFRIVKCNEDGLVRSNPISDSSKLDKLYRESQLRYQHEIPNLTISYLNVLEKILSQLSFRDNILEIGCGSGFLLDELINLGYKNVYGVEASKDAINKAPTRLKKKLKITSFKISYFQRINLA